VVQRLVLLSPGEELMGMDERSDPTAQLPTALSHEAALPRTLEEVERDHILTVLGQVGGNQSEAARLLGLKRGTLRWRLKKLGIES
jgi:DNA-binding NtrC family response regulator